MTREDRIMEVNELSKTVKNPIAVAKYIRQRIVQEEIIDAYVSPVPSAVVVDGRPKQVEVGDWVAIHSDGTQDAYKPAEFTKVFEPYIGDQKPNSIPSKRRNDDDD